MVEQDTQKKEVAGLLYHTVRRRDEREGRHTCVCLSGVGVDTFRFDFFFFYTYLFPLILSSWLFNTAPFNTCDTQRIDNGYTIRQDLLFQQQQQQQIKEKIKRK
eukprot:gene8200-5725_t